MSDPPTAADGGGTVYLPSGRYHVESPVTFRSGVRVRGEGMGANEAFTAAVVGTDGEPVDSPETVHWEARVR